MSVKQVEVGGVLCNIGQALPKDQKKLYYIVYPFADRLYKEVDDVPTLSLKEFSNVMGFVGADTMEKVEKLALSRTFVNGTDTPVSEADFSGDIDSYHELICAAVEVNLATFFTRLGEERKERLAKSKPVQAV